MKKLLRKVSVLIPIILVSAFYLVPSPTANQVQSEILLAAKEGDYIKLVNSISSGADLNSRDEHGLTPLMWAAVQGHSTVAEVLIENGADVNAVNVNGDTALMWAGLVGYEDLVKLLIEGGADVNASDPNSGVTALMAASSRGNLEIVGMLLEADANVNAVDKKGKSALAHASLKGKANIIEKLLNSGATAQGWEPSGVATAHIYLDSGLRATRVEMFYLGQPEGNSGGDGRLVKNGYFLNSIETESVTFADLNYDVE